MRVTYELPLGSDHYMHPGYQLVVPAGLPLTMDGHQVGTVQVIRAGADGHSLLVEAELAPEHFDNFAPWLDAIGAYSIPEPTTEGTPT